VADLAILVEKTGGPREREAFGLLEDAVAGGAGRDGFPAG
jgi:hypothetical protein